MSQGARDGGATMSGKSGIAHRARTAARTILLTACYLTTTPLLAQNACTLAGNEEYDKTATVSQVYDGDTLRLSNGQKVRLIGINTPEMSRNNRTAEPYAVDAKNALNALFSQNKTIKLLYGKEKKDNYGRILAHGFLADDRNIQASLLNLGLARAIAIPPNTRFSTCYQQQELGARCSKSGLWKKPGIILAKKLKPKNTGYQLLEGQVKKIDRNKQGIWLNIDNKLTIGIRPENLALFNDSVINALLNQTIIVRGWVNKSNRSTPYYLRIKHPAALQLSRDFACR